MRVANTDLTVLIRGESGVGKEIFSRIIHELSKRKHNKFIAINTGALPEGTINSELFGHEKGAFTGATSERKGYFETVNGGTIFLDEIGEMPLDTQAFLLRVLESGEFIRVGSSKVQTTDVRVIAATHINLENQIKKGKFREDLYYRLNTVPIYVPSLYERKEDIYMLFRKFAVDFSEKYRTSSIKLTEDARYLLENYRWPGNVRELKNVVEQLSVLSEDKTISADSIREIVKNIDRRNLPATIEPKSNDNFQEREILFKFLLEMKEDLSDLKNLVYNLIKTNDLDLPDVGQLSSLESKYGGRSTPNTDTPFYPTPTVYENEAYDSKPIILDPQKVEDYNNSEVIEESLSLEAMEKEMIKKALKRYNGRRKEAAEELGISERTLYRKIKQYEIED